MDEASLSRIRTDAAATQEALTVEPEEEPGAETVPAVEAPAVDTPPEAEADTRELSIGQVETAAGAFDGGWGALWELLDETERQALAALLSGETLERFAAQRGVLPELLAESLNEKAMETVGDGLLDEALALYPDYEEQVEGMMR